MASEQNPAGSHLRMMELRIERQLEMIERQKQAGEDTTEAVGRLKLLQRALDEMRIQLGQLSPTERDKMRSSAPPSLLARSTAN
jgi:hypothetical protein